MGVGGIEFLGEEVGHFARVVPCQAWGGEGAGCVVEVDALDQVGEAVVPDVADAAFWLDKLVQACDVLGDEVHAPVDVEVLRGC